MDAEQRLWVRNGPVLVRQNDVDNGVVFDPATGETHFLSELPALILSAIDSVPKTVSVMLEHLAGPMDLDAQGRTQVLAALQSLEAAELIESLPAKTE